MEQKKFDLNSFIGMILLGAIMLWYFYTNAPEIEPETISTEQVVDSSKNSAPKDAFTSNTPNVVNDSLQQIAAQNKLGAFALSAIIGAEGSSVIENDLVRLTVDNRGGQIIEALIKNYKTHDSLPLYMIKDNNASFNINFGRGF